MKRRSSRTSIPPKSFIIELFTTNYCTDLLKNKLKFTIATSATQNRQQKKNREQEKMQVKNKYKGRQEKRSHGGLARLIRGNHSNPIDSKRKQSHGITFEGICHRKQTQNQERKKRIKIDFHKQSSGMIKEIYSERILSQNRTLFPINARIRFDAQKLFNNVVLVAPMIPSIIVDRRLQLRAVLRQCLPNHYCYRTDLTTASSQLTNTKLLSPY